MVTHNRRESLLRTLDILHRTTPLAPHDWEAWVVDNASTDGSIEAVQARYPRVQIIRCPSNEGVGARSLAFARAAGEYLVLLDDDSYPVGDAVTRSMDYMDLYRDVAAVVGRVVLPDGSLEACAMPSVMLSGAVCFRWSVTVSHGRFRPEFIR
ncbi:MAG TPA: glycosyltransferase, partial [Tepidisphaeraceae bacterium]|nr:glycosyltransferase [Tepidisphaeraceae bacterium]